MKIIKVQIPKSDDDGLDEIKMDRLSSVVLLAGKNGAGKTRILTKIKKEFSAKPDPLAIESFKDQLRVFQERLEVANSQLEFQMQLDPKTHHITIESFKQQVQNWKERINDMNQRLAWNLIETDVQMVYSWVDFVPKKLDLVDCNDFTKRDLQERANGVNYGGMDNLQTGILAKIQTVQNIYFSSTHPFLNSSDDQKITAKQDYQRLDEMIRLFLNTTIGRSLENDATLFGFPIGKAKLSDGQKVLLQLCVALYSQEVALKDSVLFLDEPENHLHPSVIIEVIDKIKEVVPSCQIWIATHSIPLLAHFDPSQIWYVEAGVIKHAGKIPEKVLSSLLGDEQEIAKLQDFISLPAQLATNRFAFESLFEPVAVMTPANDKQSYQINSELKKLASNGVVKILDYGVGKGRLISNINEADIANPKSLILSIDYVGFDEYAVDKQQCIDNLSKVYTDAENRYFNDLSSLLTKHDKESFDVVIMCNVLHEIDPKEWLKLFSKEGKITQLLKGDGVLLLVEDHQISVGEKAYQKGFLVLDTPQLKELFKIKVADVKYKAEDADGRGRLKAHTIPKEYLIRIDPDSRCGAIKSLAQTAREEILKIREQDKNYVNGKLHGFWTQQFANAQLNIAELCNS